MSAVSHVHVHAAPPVSPASVLLARRGLLVGLGVVLVAAALGAAHDQGALLLTWDEPIQRNVEEARTSTLNRFFLTISRLGSTIPVLTLGTLASVVTWRRCRAVSTVLLVATFARPLLEFTIKAVVGRDRPDLDRLVPGHGPSFPTGHALAAVALWGLLPVVVSLYTHRRAIWWAATCTSVVLIVAITASRVYLGVHWFTDATAALIVGAFFLIGVEALLHRLHARHPCPLLSRAHAHAPASAPARAPAPASDGATTPGPAGGDREAAVSSAWRAGAGSGRAPC
jgi:undecaprenyl-diphosphatase